ncbi:MAG TPA: hypothetical protein PL009_14670 [Flavipsychrobacter sp.]|nr:hypothetical protein [Flavipsychrobacter sp.]
MVRIGSLLILVAATILGVQSCTNDKKENCPFIAPHMVFVGFTEDESDTIIIRRFEKNTNFTQLLDTIRINRAHLQRIEVGKDSFRLVPDNYPQLESLFYVHDWQLHLPKAKRTVEISDATPKFTQEKEPSALCQSYVSSVRFDQQTYNFISWFDNPYRVFARK